MSSLRICYYNPSSARKAMQSPSKCSNSLDTSFGFAWTLGVKLLTLGKTFAIFDKADLIQICFFLTSLDIPILDYWDRNMGVKITHQSKENWNHQGYRWLLYDVERSRRLFNESQIWWQQDGNCLTATWGLSVYCLMAAWWLPDDCLRTAWGLPEDCLRTGCIITG